MTEFQRNFDERTIAGSRCTDCERLHVPTRLHCCQRCGSTALTSERVDLDGVFESWTTLLSREPGHGESALGLVKLAAGPMLTVRIRLNHVQPFVGAPVTGWIERRGDRVDQFWFEPVADDLSERGAA